MRVFLPTTHFVTEAHDRIHATTEHVRSLRARLHVVAPRLDELEHGLATAEADRAHIAATAEADRARAAQLEAELAEREELRHTLRERLAEVGRILGQ